MTTLYKAGKTNIGLVKHAVRARDDKWGYVQGTIGKRLTEKILLEKSVQVGTPVTKYLDYIRKNYIGRRTTDCVNLAKSYVWWDDRLDEPDYDVNYDRMNGVWLTADGMFQVATVKDTINTLPEVPGVLVYKSGHMGVYIGNGNVIEAKGTYYGVVQTPLKGSGATKWTHWLLYPHIQYITGVDNMKFKDLVVNGNKHWAADIIEKAADEGIAKGIQQPDGSLMFKPNAPITRAEAVVLIMRAIGKA